MGPGKEPQGRGGGGPLSWTTLRGGGHVLVLLVLMSCQTLVNCSRSNVIRYDGDVNIGVLVDLHDRGWDGHSSCGPLNHDTVQQVMAAKWAVDVINNQSLPHELSIGLQIHDTCGHVDLTQQHLYDLISSVQNTGNISTNPRLIGLIGVGDAESLLTTSAALNAFHVPVVAVNPSFYSEIGLPKHSNILTTAPDLAGQAKSLANIGYDIGATKIALITSSHGTVATFLSEATTLGIRVQEILELIPRQINIGPAVEGFLRSIRRPLPVVALVLEAADIEAVAEHLKTVTLPTSQVWLVGSLGLELRSLKSWRTVFEGGAFVEPHMPELREFKNFFLESLKSPDFILSSAAEQYMADNTGCTMLDRGERLVGNGKGISCSNISLKEMELRFQQDPQSIEASCLRAVGPNLHNDILENLHKLSFTSMSGGLSEVEGTRHHFTKGGRLVASKQIVYTIDQDIGLEPIGWYSEDEGLHIKDEFIVKNHKGVNTTAEKNNKETPRNSPLINSSGRSEHSRSFDTNSNLDYSQEGVTGVDDIDRQSDTKKTDMSILASYSYESFIGRTWSLVVVSIALFGVCVSLWMMVYVFIKMCDGTLSGNQSMGVLLLVGVMLTFASVVPWLLPPSEVICAVRHFLHPLAFCLCFGLLLLKVMQLRSLVSVGLGGTIPQINQFLSLFFMVMVQVVITTEWYVINMPLKVVSSNLYPECDVAKETFLLLHVYPCLLLILTFLYGMSVFRIKRNYNEGRWVTCAAVCIIPVLTAWAIIYYFAPVNFHDPTNAVCIVIIGGVLLTTIFFPKMHTISQQSKYRKLKMHSPGSDSTVYTTYTTDYPRMGLTPYMSRFNGLNYLSHPYLGSNTTSYTDWSREHTPGQYYTHHDAGYCPKRYHGQHQSRKSSSKTPEGTLGSSKRSSSKRDSSDVVYNGHSGSPHKKSSLKTSPSHQLLLNPHELPTNHNYDESSRVYHITP